MPNAKVFRSSDSQSERLPAASGLETSECEGTQHGQDLLLSPKRGTMAEFLEILYSMSDDMFEGIKDERPPEERDGL